MSAVMYVCAHDGCGGKGFDEPGGTKMVCHRHPDAGRMVQYEVGSVRHSYQDAVETAGGDFKPAPVKPLKNDEAAIERVALIAEYETLAGHRANRAWNLETLRAKVEELKADDQSGKEKEPA